MNERTPACVLWGGYAWGNTGDEITLAVAIEEMRAVYGHRVAVLSRDPAYTQWLFPQVQVIPYNPAKLPYWQRKKHQISRRLGLSHLHRNPAPRHRLQDQPITGDRAWMDAIRSADLLYLVGGGYLTDLWDLSLYFLPLEWAVQNKVKIETAPVGIGPIYHPRSESTLRRLFAHAEVRVRDVISKQVCEKLDITARLEEDDGFKIGKMLSGLVTSSDQAAGPSNGQSIGICFFHQHGCSAKEQVAGWWRHLLQQLAKEGEEVRGFCFNADRRLDFNHMVGLFTAAHLPLKNIHPPDLDFRRAVQRLTDYKLIISSRFHAIITASVLGIPHIAIASGEYYKQKMQAILRPNLVPCCRVDPEMDSVESAMDFIRRHN